LNEFSNLAIGFLNFIIGKENVLQFLDHLKVEASLCEPIVVDIVLDLALFASDKVGDLPLG
jgi:hypothetical protein